MKKYDYIIGIDPDSEKSGVAVVNVKEGKLEATTSLSFPRLIEWINDRSFTLERFVVYVEASWLNGKHNWHGKSGDNRRVSSAKGYDVGRCHQTGRLIEETLRHYGIEVIECQPLKKGWKGPDGKITHEELAYFVPDLPKRTNSEVRDSVLICWYFAGFPIKVKPISTLKPKQDAKQTRS